METKNTSENALNEVVKRALEVAEKTGEFVIEQAPDLLREFYAWHTYSSIFWMVVSLVVVFLLYGKVKTAVKNFYSLDEEITDVLIAVIGGASFLGFTIAFFVNAYNLIFILSAPKLYLIEYFIR